MGGDGGEIVLFEISSLSCGSANAIFRKVKFLALMPSNCTTSSSLLRVIWTPKKGRKYLMKEEENEDNIWRGKICNSWLWCLPTTTALPPSPLPATSNLNLGANGPRRQKGRCKRSIVEIFHHYSFEQNTAFYTLFLSIILDVNTIFLVRHNF